MDYESTFIVSPELPQEKVEKLTTKAIQIIETSKGTVRVVQQLGKKKLAYAISKFREGSYVYVEFNGDGETVFALEKFFKFDDSVMRFLTVRAEKKEIVVKSASKSDTQEKSEESDQEPDVRQPVEVKQNGSKTE